jgi:hypothetical protein
MALLVVEEHGKYRRDPSTYDDAGQPGEFLVNAVREKSHHVLEGIQAPVDAAEPFIHLCEGALEMRDATFKRMREHECSPKVYQEFQSRT